VNKVQELGAMLKGKGGWEGNRLTKGKKKALKKA